MGLEYNIVPIHLQNMSGAKSPRDTVVILILEIHLGFYAWWRKMGFDGYFI
jgi:hypothetical protein